MKTAYVALILGLIMCLWAFAQTQECASLSYSEVCRAVLGMKSATMNMAILTNQILHLTTKSKLPGVRTEDIKLYIDSRSCRIPVPLTPDGTFALPVRDDLLIENPKIVANQPKGTMELHATLNLKGTLPEGAPENRGDRVRYNTLFFLEEVRSHLAKADFGELPVSNALSKTIVAVALIPQKDTDTASVIVESTNRPIVIKKTTDGIFWLRRDEDLATENPWVLMPSNHHWKVMSQIQEIAEQ